MANSQHYIELGLFRATRKVCALLSIPQARRIGAALGYASYLLFGRRRKLALANLALVFPEKPLSWHDRIARTCFQRFASAYLESVAADGLPAAAVLGRFEIDGWGHVEEAMARNRGMVLLASHFGNSDMAVHPLSARIDGLTILHRPQSNPLINEDFRDIRTRRGGNLLSRTKSSLSMLGVLRRNGVLALAADQRVRPWDGILVSFLDKPAWTSPIPAQLSRITGAPIVPLNCEPRPGGRYSFELSPPILPEESDGDDPIGHLTQRIADATEQLIRRDPASWLWPHRRWQRCQQHSWHKALARTRRESRVDPGFDLSAFTDDQTGKRLLAWAQSATYERGESLVVCGPPECLDRYATALINQVLAQRHTARLLDDDDLSRLASSRPANEAIRWLRELDRHDVVVRISSREELGTSRLRRLLEHRRTRRSIALFLASNVADALPNVSSLVDHCTVVEVPPNDPA